MQNQLQVERLRQTSSTKTIRPDLETSRNKKLSILPIFFLFLCHILFFCAMHMHIAIVDVDVTKSTNEIS